MLTGYGEQFVSIPHIILTSLRQCDAFLTNRVDFTNANSGPLSPQAVPNRKLFPRLTQASCLFLPAA